jgi:hypothetical protein
VHNGGALHEVLKLDMNPFSAVAPMPTRRRNPAWLIVQTLGCLLIVGGIISFAQTYDDDRVNNSRVVVQALGEAAVLAGANVRPPAEPDAYLKAIGTPGKTPEETADRIAVLTGEASFYSGIQSEDVSYFIALWTAAVGALALGLNRGAKFVRVIRNVPD